MFRSLFPFRRLLATSFLLVFVNVFAGQCWCAMLKPVLAAPRTAALAQPAKKSAHACCQSREAVAKHNAKQKEHSPGSHRHHDCCKDKSASLLSSLTTPAQKHLLVPAPAVLLTAVEFHFRPLAGKWNRTATVALVPPRQLKPKIPDIRIFIQSLTV